MQANSIRRKSCFLCASVSLWLAFAAEARSADPPLAPVATPVDGQPFEARLLAVDDMWNLEFVKPGGDVRKLPAADLVQWGTWPESKGTKQVVLADGGLLPVAEVLGIQDDKLVVESDLLTAGLIRLPLDSLAGVVFQAPLELRRRDLLEDRLLSGSGDSDRVLLGNGDELTGTIGGLTDKSLQLKTEIGSTSVDRSRLTAMIFNPALRAKSSTEEFSAWVGLRDGSRLLASQLIANGKQAELTLDDTSVLRIPIDAIAALLPIGGRVVYLSELSPAGYRHIPFLNLPWDYRVNCTVGGIALRAGGQRHLMGLGMHSAARLTYDLDRPYRRFEASLAIDDETAGRGSIVGRVFTDDGSGEWKLRYESPIVRGGQTPVPVNVDLNGAKRLSLLIDFADRADEGDHADWLDARLVKP